MRDLPTMSTNTDHLIVLFTWTITKIFLDLILSFFLLMSFRWSMMVSYIRSVIWGGTGVLTTILGTSLVWRYSAYFSLLTFRKMVGPFKCDQSLCLPKFTLQKKAESVTYLLTSNKFSMEDGCGDLEFASVISIFLVGAAICWPYTSWPQTFETGNWIFYQIKKRWKINWRLFSRTTRRECMMTVGNFHKRRSVLLEVTFKFFLP